MLIEKPLAFSTKPISRATTQLIEEGRSRFETVHCFHFVPSNYEMVWRALDTLPRGRCCEWGSGFGIGHCRSDGGIPCTARFLFL